MRDKNQGRDLQFWCKTSSFPLPESWTSVPMQAAQKSPDRCFMLSFLWKLLKECHMHSVYLLLPAFCSTIHLALQQSAKTEIDKIIYKYVLLPLGLQGLPKSCFFRPMLTHPSPSLSWDYWPKISTCKAVGACLERVLMDLLTTSTRTLRQKLQP